MPHISAVTSVADESGSRNTKRPHRPYTAKTKVQSVYLGAQLERYLRESGIKAIELDRRLGLTLGNTNRWTAPSLRRQRPVAFRHIPRLVAIFGGSQHELLHGTGQECAYLLWAAANAVHDTGFGWCEIEPPDGEPIEDVGSEPEYTSDDELDCYTPLPPGSWPRVWTIYEDGRKIGSVVNGQFHQARERVREVKYVS